MVGRVASYPSVLRAYSCLCVSGSLLVMLKGPDVVPGMEPELATYKHFNPCTVPQTPEKHMRDLLNSSSKEKIEALEGRAQLRRHPFKILFKGSDT